MLNGLWCRLHASTSLASSRPLNFLLLLVRPGRPREYLRQSTLPVVMVVTTTIKVRYCQDGYWQVYHRIARSGKPWSQDCRFAGGDFCARLSFSSAKKRQLVFQILLDHDEIVTVKRRNLLAILHEPNPPIDRMVNVGSLPKPTGSDEQKLGSISRSKDKTGNHGT